MAKPPRGSDLVTLLRGLSRVGSAVLDVRSQEVSRAWTTSSLRPLIIQGSSNLQETITKVLQEPQTLQKDVSKGAAEALARISMVTEGIKAYRNGPTPAAGFSQETAEGYDPMYDPNVQELSIEEVMMQEAVSGHSDQTVAGMSLKSDRQFANALSGIQEVADTIGESANETKEAVKRFEQFEPFLDITEVEEREITEEHLQAIDDKLYDLQDVSLGYNLRTFKEVEDSKPVKEAVEDGIKEQMTTQEGFSQETAEGYDPMYDPNVQELSIEEVLMQEAVSGHSDQTVAGMSLGSDRQFANALSGIQEVADTIGESANETKEAIKRFEQFEPFLDITDVEEREITEEHLQAMDDKLYDLQDASLGHNLRTFEEEEDSKPVKEAVEKKVTDSLSDPYEQELSIEEVLMQEALSGHNNQTVVEFNSGSDKQATDVLSGVHEVGETISENIEEIDKRKEQFESFLNITKFEEREITEEHIQVLDEKLSEIQDIAFGHDLRIFKEVEHSKPLEKVMEDVIKEQETIKGDTMDTVDYGHKTGKQVMQNMDITENAEEVGDLSDPYVQELSVEEVLMQEALSGQNDQTVTELPDGSDRQFTDAFIVAHEVADTSMQNTKAAEEISERMKQYEPFLDITKIEEREITQEHLQVLDEKLSELQDVAFGHNLKIFKEAEHYIPEEKIIQDVGEQTITENMTEVKDAIQENFAQDVNEERALKDHALQSTSSSQKSVFENKDADADLDSSLSQVAKTVDHGASYTSSVSHVESEQSNNITDTTNSFSAKITPNTIPDVCNTSAVDSPVESDSKVDLPLTESVASTSNISLPDEPNPVSIDIVPEMHAITGADAKVEVDPIAGSPQTEDIAVNTSTLLLNTSSAHTGDVKVQTEPRLEPPFAVGVSSTTSTLSQDVSAPTLISVDSGTTVSASTVLGENVEVQVVPELEQSQMESFASTTSTSLKEDTLPATTGSHTSNSAAATNVEVHIDSKVEPSQTESATSTTVTLSPDESSSCTSIISDATADVEGQTKCKLEPPHTDSVSSSASTLSQGLSAHTLISASSGTTVDAGLTGTVDARTVTTTAATVAATTMCDTDNIQMNADENWNNKARSAGTDFTLDAVASTNVSSSADEMLMGTTTNAAATRPLASSGKTPTVHEKTHKAPLKPKPKLLGKKPLAKEKPKSSLSDSAQARKVPHSRIGRLMSFGGLAAGLGVGAIAEVTRRSLGLNQGKDAGSLLDGSPFLTEANAKRIVDTLCRVRGAALKLGQMLSIQDSALINPQLQKIFERVRQSADFMPAWQLEKAIAEQLGEDWRSKVASFDERPYAAASIGQVHIATLHDGRSVAMKIQYPGVAEGIESDINNLISTLKVADIIPEGLFVDSVIEVAKRELSWECDYIREAECTRRFSELVKSYPEYYVPEVIPELCTQQVFTTELIDGVPVDKCVDMDQDTRNFISEKIVHLCLLELFNFGYMQTDPNWSNFFYNADTEQVALLDFGACREYRKDFVDKYIHLIHGAAVKDHDKILKYSQELGFLTGHEAKVMEKAHVDAIMILGEAFQEDKPFHFGDQDTTYRIQHLVPVMLSHRMCAPPEESYSLHRKMSGVFLLCAKLNGMVNCYTMFHDIFNQYKFGGTWEDFHSGRL